MIKSFADRETRDFFHGLPKATRKLGTVAAAAARKLDMLNAAHTLDDLRVPPANRLEALKGSLRGLHSIRINDQWRIVFRWNDGAESVRIVDYH